jgi:predicted HAD superfamily hydrolase
MLISFDVFDTAIQRTVYKPTDLFLLVNSTFKEKRIEAENLARNDKKVYNIIDIYKYLPEYDINIEIALELDNCKANNKIYEIYKNHIDNGDRVIFISDMYLPSAIIIQMLEKCGYSNPELYVSCECNSQKGDGTLFEYVQNKLQIKIDKHYGDNYYSDIVSASKVGITPEYTPKIEDKKTDVPNISPKLMKYMVENEHKEQDLNSYVAGYFAPILYDFTKWVLDSRDKTNPQSTIFFNSRDGFVPYLVAKDIFGADNIKYIHTSRKSTCSALLDLGKDITHDDNCFANNRLCGCGRLDSYEAFLKAMNINEDIDKLILPASFNISELIRLNKVKFYNHFKYKTNLLKKYMEKVNIKDGDLFVDIGYFGSSQYAIERCMNISLNGYYFQNFENPHVNSIRNSYFKSNVMKYCFLAESIFTSDGNGVLSYDDNGNVIFYEDNKFKKEFSRNMIDNIVNSCKYLHENNINTTYIDIEKLIVRFMYYPNNKEILYGNESIFENGDISEYQSITNYNRELIKQGLLQECYNKSYWKPAFEKLLQNDNELCHLEKYLRKEY